MKMIVAGYRGSSEWLQDQYGIEPGEQEVTTDDLLRLMEFFDIQTSSLVTVQRKPRTEKGVPREKILVDTRPPILFLTPRGDGWGQR